VAVAQIRLRRERERAGAPVPALRMWLFPWASYAAIVGMLAILVAMALTPGQAKDLYFSLVTLVLACARTWSCAAAVRGVARRSLRRELNACCRAKRRWCEGPGGLARP